jgi:hypothetical protein
MTPAYGGGGSSVAVSVTVPDCGVSWVVVVGDDPLGVVDRADGSSWSLVCGLGVV